MSLQSVLGTMLATGMAGRSNFGADHLGATLHRSGFGNPRGGGLGQMAGLGALGYLAYKALQARRENLAATAQTAGRSGGEPRDTLGGDRRPGGLLEDLFGMRRETGADPSPKPSLGERLSRILEGGEAASSEALPEPQMEDRHALLLIRAMITAANADGSISESERQRILSAVQQADAGTEDRRVLERELTSPQPLDWVLAQANDEDTAAQIYLASRAAIDQGSEAGRAYLAYLGARLPLPPERLQQIAAA